MKPFKNIQSQNFGFLLFVARAVTFLGYFFFVCSCLFVAFQFTKFGALTAFTGIGLIILPIGIIVTGGVVATLISIEENIRIKTTRAVSNSET